MANDNNKELEEVEKLEADVSEMAQKILEYRTTLPDQLKNCLASTLAAQRPLVPTSFSSGSEPESFGNPNEGGSAEGPLSIEGDEKTAEKARLLKEKISENISALPRLLKRMRDCISRIDNLESSKGLIHPAFRKRRD